MDAKIMANKIDYETRSNKQKANIIGILQFIVTKHIIENCIRTWIIKKNPNEENEIKEELSDEQFKERFGIALTMWLEMNLLEETEYILVSSMIIAKL